MGEVCNAGSRLLIDKPIAKEFIERFIEKGKTAYRPATRLTRRPISVRWSPRRTARA